MFEAFNKVTKVIGLGPHCPARLNIVTGELQLNYDVWPYLTEAQRRDVVRHEEGHWVLQTRSEYEADRYSLLKQAQGGHSLKQAVAAMADILDPTNPEHVSRAWARFELAKQLDNKMSNQQTCECGGRCGGHVQYTGTVNGDPFVNFLGICLSKKCKEKKAAKKDAKFQMRLETKASKNEARVLLAEQGVKTGIGGAFQDLGNAAAAVVGGLTGGASALAGVITGGDPATTQAISQSTPAALEPMQPATIPLVDYSAIQMQEQAEAAAKKKKTTWIIIGVVAVVVIGLAIYFIRKKSK